MKISRAFLGIALGAFAFLTVSSQIFAQSGTSTKSSASKTSSSKTSAGQTSDRLQAGLWQINRENSGGPGGGRKEQLEVCYSEETLSKNPAQPFLPTPPKRDQANAPAQSANAPQCELSDLKQAKGKAEFNTLCKTQRGEVRGKWLGTYTPTSFDMSGTTKVAMFTIKGKTQGRHLGACPETVKK
jgi:hypothetical protein